MGSLDIRSADGSIMSGFSYYKVLRKRPFLSEIIRLKKTLSLGVDCCNSVISRSALSPTGQEALAMLEVALVQVEDSTC